MNRVDDHLRTYVGALNKYDMMNIHFDKNLLYVFCSVH